MTQITKEAIEAAWDAYQKFGWSTQEGMKKAIEAALPFLSTLPIAGEGKVKALEWEPHFYAKTDELVSLTADLPGREWAYKIEPVTANVNFRLFIEGREIRNEATVYWPLSEAKAAAQADYNTRILSALISSPGKDGGQEVEAVGELREALQRLEDCCDQLAGTRSREVYDAMINSGQAEALIDLDNARLNAREVLSRPSPYPVSDTVAVVTGDAALALGLPEGTKLYTRPQPASTALVEAARHLLEVGEFCRTDDTEKALRNLRIALHEDNRS